MLPKVGKGNVCVIYDSDERYAKRLMGIINDSKDIPYKARIFTRKEEFNKYIVDNDTDVLMVNEECYTYEVQKKSDSNVIVLCMQVPASVSDTWSYIEKRRKCKGYKDI